MSAAVRCKCREFSAGASLAHLLRCVGWRLVVAVAHNTRKRFTLCDDGVKFLVSRKKQKCGSDDLRRSLRRFGSTATSERLIGAGALIAPTLNGSAVFISHTSAQQPIANGVAKRVSSDASSSPTIAAAAPKWSTPAALSSSTSTLTARSENRLSPVIVSQAAARCPLVKFSKDYASNASIITTATAAPPPPSPSPSPPTPSLLRKAHLVSSARIADSSSGSLTPDAVYIDDEIV